jgi:hypothetical protein
LFPLPSQAAAPNHVIDQMTTTTQRRQQQLNVTRTKELEEEGKKFGSPIDWQAGRQAGRQAKQAGEAAKK